MEQFSKESKRGTIQSFFSSHIKKNQKSNNSLTSCEITAVQPDERLVHVTRHFADQVLKKIFSSSRDLNKLLDAVLNADYELDIYFVKKLDFGIESRVLNFSKIVF
jgi:hypothetical protein